MRNKITTILLFLLSLSIQGFAQAVAIKGQVVDELNEPLMGATIYELGSDNNGVIADLDGNFIIQVKSTKAQLKVSYVGFVDKTVKVVVDKKMTIVLGEDSELLDEVVVVGYGRQKKITSVGSISEIKSSELRQTPSASLQNALAGKVPGLFQQQASGQPGADAANIYIRGVSTFSNVSKSPLVLIDDIETSYEAFTQMDSNEVESVTLLKDASSTAIYGVKGANGVILVTTRRGTESKPRITYRAELGLQNPTVKNKVLNSYESLVLLKEFWMNQGKNPHIEMPGLVTDEALEHFRVGDDPFRYPDVDWYDQVMRKVSPQMRHNFDIVGGTKTVKYFVSLGYFDQEGIMKNLKRKEDFEGNYYFKRYNVRSNIDIQATKTTKISVSASGTFSEKNEPHTPDPNSDGGAWPFWRRLASGRLTSWAYPAKNHDGSYGGTSDRKYSTNPLMVLEYGGYRRDIKNHLNGHISIDQNLDKITKGLKIKGTLALTNSWGYNRRIERNNFPDFQYNKVTGDLEPVFIDRDPLPTLGSSSYVFAPFRKITSNIVVNYGREFGRHGVSAMGLLNWDTSKSGAGDPDNLKGMSGRVAYDYAHRYMLEFNVGYNGSDRFKAKNKYGTFPAISVGWNASEEKFMKPIFDKIKVDFLKLRASYGLVGSDRLGGGQYLFLETYNEDNSNSGYYFGETPSRITGIYPGTLGNDNVTWEKEKKLDIGLDLRMFNQKLNIVFDYFKNERYDILTTRKTIPDISSLALPSVNLGRVENKGVELEVTWRDRLSSNFNYFIRGNISTAKNKILEMDEAQELYPNLRREGRPVGQLFGYIEDGFYNNQEEIDAMPDYTRDVQPGDIRYKDISGPDGKPDGIIDKYDQGPIGNPSIPQITYGFSLGFNYKNFDFSMLFQGAAKGSIMSQQVLDIGGVDGRPREIHKHRWTPENQDKAKFPRIGNNGNMDDSTFWLRPRDYLRLKNIEIGYTFPKSLTEKVSLQSARLFVNGNNLLTWSNLSIYDIDPESNTGSSAAYSNYPQMRVFNFGVQVTF